MNPGWLIDLTHAALLVCLGMTLEVLFTAFSDLPKAKDWRLMGHTYVWMVPIYALVYPLLACLYPRLSHWPILGRGALYVALIFAVEYASGWALRAATGRCPWDYGRAKWAVHGLIRLDYAPAWLGASLLYELVFRVLTGRL